ncbi:MAG: mandelate racemase/muconate lactonizing enzyme family protein [Firmicutes bacterium]|nr:mandelate racemase/muconate lactonizing enzyme family protein [Bacillota bacterium]
MKITRVEAIPVRQSSEVLINNDSAQDGIIIKVYTDEGIVGYGEVDSSPLVIKAIIDAPVSHNLCRGLGQSIIGMDPFEIDKIWETMYYVSTFYGRRGAAIQAIGGIDIALWDILGKALNKPIYKLLGGEFRTKVRAYASVLMPDTPEECYELTKKVCSENYSAIKLGWGGFGQSFRQDIALVKAAREAAGPDIDLMFDIGFVPSPDYPIDAVNRINLVKEIEQYKPYWIEEPLFPDDLEGYRKLSEAVDTRIACGENESTRYGFKELIEVAKVDILQPDVTRCGGLSEAKRIANLAQVHHLTVVPHCWSSGIVEAASMHLIASIPNACLLEYCKAETPIRQEISEEIVVKDGYAEVPQKPGLGIEINEDALQKYAANYR